MSVALVLVDRSTLVERQVGEAYPSLIMNKQRKVKGSGMWAGWQAGQLADLGHGAQVRAGKQGALN